jgi:hypothetical protein
MALSSTVKAQKIASAAATVVERSLIVPNLMTKVGLDEFRGAANDTVNIKVPGILPAHDLTWRSERSSNLTLDAFSERTYAVSFGGNVYQATKLQDEQVDFDNVGWQKVVPIQAEAIGRNIEGKALAQLGAPTFPGNSSLSGVSGSASAYSYMVAGAKSGRDLKGTLLALRYIANKIGMGSSRTLVISAAIEAQILAEATALGLTTANMVGEGIASSALREATIGRLFGMNFVTAQELADDKAYLTTPGAYVMATAAPSVPQSVPFGGTGSSKGGVSVRVLRDYDALQLVDRSVLNTYVGFRAIPDVVLMDPQGTAAVSTGEYFIRAIALDMDATADVLPAAASELDKAFSVNATAGLPV